MPLPDDLLIGHSEIDEQHRQFFTKVEEFHTAVNSGLAHEPFLRSFLDYLIDYTVAHFRSEEALMLEVQYPSLYPHRQEHFAFWRSCLAIREICEACQYAPLCAKQLNERVVTWLAEHIQVEDRAYMEWMRARRNGEH